MPCFAHAHYITETLSPFPADWEHNSEMNYPLKQNMTEDILAKKIEFVLLEKGRETEIEQKGHWGSAISKKVKLEWSLYRDANYFTVYQNPLFRK